MTRFNPLGSSASRHARTSGPQEQGASQRPSNAGQSRSSARATPRQFEGLDNSGGSGSAPRMDPDTAATQLQALARGHLARKEIKVSSHDGVVHVDVHGGPETFAKIGLGQFAGAYPKTLHYKAMDASKFRLHAVGGDRIRQPMEMSGQHINAALLDHPQVADAHVNVMQNASFYNAARHVDSSVPSATAIGNNRTLGGRQLPPLRSPQQYADVLETVDLGTSGLKSGPLLSRGGEQQFGARQMAEPRFQYRPEQGRPMLDHANQPNPRSAIGLPAQVGYGGNSLPSTHGSGPADSAHWDAVRMASFTATTRGSHSDGVTMADLAATMTKLDRHNASQSQSHPSRTINLDGGGSLYNGQIDHRGRKNELDVPGRHNGAPNYLVATSKQKVR
ncbi:hypothetical protein [Burkholderia alba]|uniref:hypothetical protein n=1 Tax=Burkholderia alba TaxID=2683677 RepID=UPI002B05902F|nr:hypothetical protein [Burkholderia alba]